MQTESQISGITVEFDVWSSEPLCVSGTGPPHFFKANDIGLNYLTISNFVHMSFTFPLEKRQIN